MVNFKDYIVQGIDARPEGMSGRDWCQHLGESDKVMCVDKSSWKTEEQEVDDN